MRKSDRNKLWLAGGRLRPALAIALLVVLILVVGVLGDRRILGDLRAGSKESVRQSESAAESQRIEEALREETAVHEIQLSEGEEALLLKLTQSLEQTDLKEAARLLNDEADSFQSLFFEKPADKTCLFDGAVMKDKADGYGLVFQKAGTVFYGSFRDGRPSGQCVALQAVSLKEGVRYDYSAGFWKNGKMEGEGECGYDYYEGVTGDGAKKTVKKGGFLRDLMDGAITYSSMDADGAETTWSMMVKDGVIVPDERWISDTADEGTPVYRLASDTDPGRAYVVEGDAFGLPLWKNRVMWE